MARYGGPVPQAWVDRLGPQLSKSASSGAVIAEQLIRENYEVYAKAFGGVNLSADEKRALPIGHDGNTVKIGGGA